MKQLFENWQRYLNEEDMPPRSPEEEPEKMDPRPIEPADQLVTTDITDVDIEPEYERGPHKRVGNFFKVYQRIVNNYEPVVDKVASNFTETPEEKRKLKLFLAGTMAAESGAKPTRKKSSKNAQGITQFLPYVAKATAMKLLGMSSQEFKKNWRLVRAGDPKSVEFMLNLSAALYNKMKDPILKKYEKLHKKKLEGPEFFNAMHTAYSHGPYHPYFKRRLERNQLTTKGLKHGVHAYGYISKAAQVRFYYEDYLNRKATTTRRMPRTPPEESRSPRFGMEGSSTPAVGTSAPYDVKP